MNTPNTPPAPTPSPAGHDGTRPPPAATHDTATHDTASMGDAGMQQAAKASPTYATGTALPAAAPQAAQDTHAEQHAWRHLRLRTLLWRAVALVFTGLGIVGVVLPVMPHVPFFLVALWAAGKGWPALERRLLEHPQIGPQLRNWRENRAVSLPVKCVTTLMMAGSAIGMQVFGNLPMWVRIGAPCFMLIGLVFIWTRPSK